GFQPQKLITGEIDAALKNVPEWNEPASPVRPLEIITFVFMLISGWYAFHSARVLGVLLFAVAAIAFVGLIVAISARRRVDVAPLAPIVLAWGVILAGGFAVFSAVSYALTDVAAASVAVAAALAATCLLLVGRSREAIAKIEFRR